MLHILWCLFSISISASIAYLLRLLVSHLCGDSMKIMVLYDEFAGQFVSAVTLMELVVLQSAKHSNWSFLTYLYIILFLRNLYFTKQGLYESPLTFADLYYQGNKQQTLPLYHILLVIFIQSIAVLFGQLFTKVIWQYQDEFHIHTASEGCLTTLSHEHNWYECFAVEMLGTFIYTFVDLLIPNRVRFYTRPFALCIAISYFGHVTGAWLNPMLATVFTFRCHGHDSDVMHVLIYWIAPFVGFFLAWELFLKLKRNIGDSKDENENEKEKTE